MVTNTLHDGWIKLHRKSINSQVWRNSHLWQLWCYCLIRANHQPQWVSVTTGRGETQVYVKAGQFIFGRFSAAKDLRAKPDATYKRLLKLKSMQNLTTQNKYHYTIVTICNWGLYQNTETKITTQVTPNYHPSNTNKNDKNDKNITTIVLRVVNHWNQYKARTASKNGQAIHWHRHTLKDGKAPPAIEAAVKQNIPPYTAEDICGAIDNYAKVLLNPDYRWTYVWPLSTFLTVKHEKHKNADRKWWQFLPDNFIEENHLTPEAKERRRSGIGTGGPTAKELALAVERRSNGS